MGLISPQVPIQGPLPWSGSHESFLEDRHAYAWLEGTPTPTPPLPEVSQGPAIREGGSQQDEEPGWESTQAFAQAVPGWDPRGARRPLSFAGQGGQATSVGQGGRRKQQGVRGASGHTWRLPGTWGKAASEQMDTNTWDSLCPFPKDIN